MPGPSQLSALVQMSMLQNAQQAAMQQLPGFQGYPGFMVPHLSSLTFDSPREKHPSASATLLLLYCHVYTVVLDKIGLLSSFKDLRWFQLRP